MLNSVEKTSDYLTTDELKKINKYFQKERNLQMSLLIELGFRTMLRYSDISRLKWIDVIGKDEIVLNELKTGKKRIIKIGDVLKEILNKFYILNGEPNETIYLFSYSLRHTNRLLQFAARYVGIRKKNVSTHSLRKSGARFIWEENNKTDDIFLKISMILNHSNTSISRRYLGITREEISDVYAGFDIVL